MRPEVSVCITTYNHETFIAQAVRSALAQRLDVSFEIVIGEDCSTDHTYEVCEELARSHRDVIRLHHRERNLGMMGNFVQTLSECQGRYTAVLEGDDFWTSEHKLARQIEFLDAHLDVSICSHNVQIGLDTEITQSEWLGPKHRQELTLEDLLEYGSAGATCSLVFRRDAVRPLPGWYAKMPGGDWSLQVLCAEKGKMYYMRETLGVYRKHAHGAVYYQRREAERAGKRQSGIPTENSLKICDAIDQHFALRYSHLLNRQRAYWNWMGAVECAGVDRKRTWSYLYKALRLLPVKEWSRLPDFKYAPFLLSCGACLNGLKKIRRESSLKLAELKRRILPS